MDVNLINNYCLKIRISSQLKILGNNVTPFGYLFFKSNRLFFSKVYEFLRSTYTEHVFIKRVIQIVNNFDYMSNRSL